MDNTSCSEKLPFGFSLREITEEITIMPEDLLEVRQRKKNGRFYVELEGGDVKRTLEKIEQFSANFKDNDRIEAKKNRLLNNPFGFGDLLVLCASQSNIFSELGINDEKIRESLFSHASKFIYDKSLELAKLEFRTITERHANPNDIRTQMSVLRRFQIKLMARGTPRTDLFRK